MDTRPTLPDGLPTPTWCDEQWGVALYHGDCLEILPWLPDGCVDMAFSDPPYGHNNNNGDLIHNWEAALGRGKAGPSRPIEGDGFDMANELVQFFFAQMPKLLATGGCCCCCCGGGGPDPQFARWALWMDVPLQFKQMIVWDKGPMGMGWHYRRSYETVLVAQKRGGACKWYDDSKAVENIIRPGQDGIRKIIPSSTQHPTEKPVALPTWFVRLHTQQTELVLDPFMGRGATGVACVNLNRAFIGIELDRHWFDKSVDRIKTAIVDAQGGPLFADRERQLDLIGVGT